MTGENKKLEFKLENLKDIYKLELAEICEALETSEEEARERLEIYGENKTAQGKKKTILRIFSSQFGY